MIKVQMTVREAMDLARYASNDMYEKIVCALEVALGVNQRLVVTITGGMNTDNRISCIKAIRLHSGWGLKEAKEWSDYLVGGWHYDKWYPAPANVQKSMTLKTPEAAEALLRELTTLGCEGFLS